MLSLYQSGGGAVPDGYPEGYDPQFTLLWVGIAAVAVVLDDVIRWRFFGEERPHYRLCRTRS